MYVLRHDDPCPQVKLMLLTCFSDRIDKPFASAIFA